MESSKEPSHLDCRKLIRRFGGPAQLHRRLVARGHDLSFKTVEKWRERDVIRTPWVAELIVMAKEDGYPVNLLDFIQPNTQEQGTGAVEAAEDEDGLI